MRPSEPTIAKLAQTRKPGDKKSFWNSLIVDAACSWGPLRAITTAPRMQSADPSHPNVVSRSLRKKWERTFETTTEIAPSGVTRIYIRYALSMYWLGGRARMPVRAFLYASS